MPFEPRDWKDAPSEETPITAAALEDMETRLSDYTDEEVATRAAASHTHAQSDVTGLVDALSAKADASAVADALAAKANASSLGAEITARTDADTALDARVDALELAGSGSPVGPEVGTTIGETTVDGSGQPVVTFASVWGIDGSGNAYHDADGAVNGEAAILTVDADSNLIVNKPTGAVSS
jgi:hypothetical protein